MRRLKIVVLVVLVLALCSLTLLGRNQRQRKSGYVSMNEEGIRLHAIAAPMPVYPEAATNAGAQGLVDLAVMFDEDGKAKRIKILESPDPAISKAVEDAVKQWTVRVLYDSELLPGRTVGELRFHFVIKDGVARVENPSREEQGILSKAFKKAMWEECFKPRNPS